MNIRGGSHFLTFLRRLPETTEHPCSYYPDRISRLKAFLFDSRFRPEFVDVLNGCGFRRSGSLYYRTSCPGCNDCIAYRIPVRSFSPSRTQKRLVRRNIDLKRTVGLPHLSREKEDLYLHYQYRQHFLKPVPGKEEEAFDRQRALRTMREQMYSGSPGSLEFEFRLEGRLIAFAVFDPGQTGLSAVYSVYDPDLAGRSLGTYMILSAIEWSWKQGFSHVYLGYYIPGHMKMDYKKMFRPGEILNPDTGEWIPAERFGT